MTNLRELFLFMEEKFDDVNNKDNITKTHPQFHFNPIYFTSHQVNNTLAMF